MRSSKPLPHLKRAIITGLLFGLIGPLFIWNSTPSSPTGLYLWTPLRPHADNFAVCCVPYRDSTQPSLRCPNQSTVIKRILATGPLTITNLPAAIDPATRRPVLPTHDTVFLPDHTLYLAGQSPDSWDSRYYGPIPTSACRRLLYLF